MLDHFLICLAQGDPYITQETSANTALNQMTNVDWFLVVFLFALAPLITIVILNICLKDVPEQHRTVSPGAFLFGLIPGVWVVELFLMAGKKVPESLGEHVNAVEKHAHEQIRAKRGGQPAGDAGGEGGADQAQDLPVLEVGDCNKMLGLFWGLACGVPNLVGLLCYMVVLVNRNPQYIVAGRYTSLLGMLVFAVLAVIYVIRYKDTVGTVKHWHPY